MKRLKTPALARLQALALRSGSPVDDGVAQALEQNNKLAAAVQKALDDFKKDWCDQAALTTEAETFARKHEGAKKEDVATQCTATVGCYLKYLDVPEGTIDNVSLDNNKDPEASDGNKAITQDEADENIDGEEDGADVDDEDDDDDDGESESDDDDDVNGDE